MVWGVRDVTGGGVLDSEEGVEFGLSVFNCELGAVAEMLFEGEPEGAVGRVGNVCKLGFFSKARYLRWSGMKSAAHDAYAPIEAQSAILPLPDFVLLGVKRPASSSSDINNSIFYSLRFASTNLKWIHQVRTCPQGEGRSPPKLP